MTKWKETFFASPTALGPYHCCSECSCLPHLYSNLGIVIRDIFYLDSWWTISFAHPASTGRRTTWPLSSFGRAWRGGFRESLIQCSVSRSCLCWCRWRKIGQDQRTCRGEWWFPGPRAGGWRVLPLLLSLLTCLTSEEPCQFILSWRNGLVDCSSVRAHSDSSGIH